MKEELKENEKKAIELIKGLRELYGGIYGFWAMPFGDAWIDLVVVGDWISLAFIHRLEEICKELGLEMFGIEYIETEIDKKNIRGFLFTLEVIK